MQAEMRRGREGKGLARPTRERGGSRRDLGLGAGGGNRRGLGGEDHEGWGGRSGGAGRRPRLPVLDGVPTMFLPLHQVSQLHSLEAPANDSRLTQLDCCRWAGCGVHCFLGCRGRGSVSAHTWRARHPSPRQEAAGFPGKRCAPWAWLRSKPAGSLGGSGGARPSPATINALTWCGDLACGTGLDWSRDGERNGSMNGMACDGWVRPFSGLKMLLKRGNEVWRRRKGRQGERTRGGAAREREVTTGGWRRL